MSKNIGNRTIDFLRHTASAQIQPSVAHTKLAITQSHCQTASPVQDAQPSDVKMTTVQLHNERRRNGQRVRQHNGLASTIISLVGGNIANTLVQMAVAVLYSG